MIYYNIMGPERKIFLTNNFDRIFWQEIFLTENNFDKNIFDKNIFSNISVFVIHIYMYICIHLLRDTIVGVGMCPKTARSLGQSERLRTTGNRYRIIADNQHSSLITHHPHCHHNHDKHYAFIFIIMNTFILIQISDFRF